MKLKSIFSARELAKRLKSAYFRFPAPTILLSLTCFLWIVNIFTHFTNEIETLIWSGSLATLSTLIIYLWCELLQNRKWLKAWIIAAVAVSVADYIYITENSNFGTNAEFLGRGALITALIIGIIFPPVAKGASLRSIFNFSINQLCSAALTIALSTVLAFAVAIILITISILFHWSNEKLTECLLILFSAWIPGLFYLNIISHIRKAPSEKTNSPLGNVSLYVLLPIAVVYTIILYIYGLKILIQWELPQDSISLMVSGLLCVSLVTIYGLQAFSLNPGTNLRTKIATLTAKWLPIALLPLFFLMTIGLIYRINQYGLTIPRIYLATFNLWAYIIIIYLTFKQQKAKLNSVAASFAAVFALVSIFPYLNYSNLVLSYIRHSIFTELGALSYPVSLETIQERINELPEKKAQALASRIDYYYDHASKRQIAELTNYDGYLTERMLLPKAEDPTDYNTRMDFHGLVTIPEGYKTIKQISFSKYSWEKYEKLDNGLVKITDDSISVTINIDSLSNIVRTTPRALYVPATTPDDSAALYTITNASFLSNDSISRITGYMFQH